MENQAESKATASKQFSGAIVLKAPSEAEVEALAAQLAWYADFSEPFKNRYEGGWVLKGQVLAAPVPDVGGIATLMARLGETHQESFAGEGAILAAPADVEIALAVLRSQAAEIGRLRGRIEELERDLETANTTATWHARWSSLLTPAEHMRLIDRGIVREHPHLGPAWVVEADAQDPARQRFASEVLEVAARHIEDVGPDDPLVNLRVAERCAAMVRALKTKEENNVT